MHPRGARQDTGAHCHRESGGLNTGNVSMHMDKIKRRQSTWELARWQLFPPPGLKGRRVSSYQTRWDLCPWEKDQPVECRLLQRDGPLKPWLAGSERGDKHPPSLILFSIRSQRQGPQAMPWRGQPPECRAGGWGRGTRTGGGGRN